MLYIIIVYLSMNIARIEGWTALGAGVTFMFGLRLGSTLLLNAWIVMAEYNIRTIHWMMARCEYIWGIVGLPVIKGVVSVTAITVIIISWIYWA